MHEAVQVGMEGSHRQIGRGAGPLMAESHTAITQTGVRSRMQAPFSLCKKAYIASEWGFPQSSPANAVSGLAVWDARPSGRYNSGQLCLRQQNGLDGVNPLIPHLNDRQMQKFLTPRTRPLLFCNDRNSVFKGQEGTRAGKGHIFFSPFRRSVETDPRKREASPRKTEKEGKAKAGRERGKERTKREAGLCAESPLSAHPAPRFSFCLTSDSRVHAVSRPLAAATGP
eukprot:358822-Chlamydomonas_euryale.AAC.1